MAPGLRRQAGVTFRMRGVHRFSKLRTTAALVVVSFLLIACMPGAAAASHASQPNPTGQMDPAEVMPISLSLSGWGWRVTSGCVSCTEYGNAVLDLHGSVISADNAMGARELYLTGTLSLNTRDTTDNFTVELRGARVRSTFFLREVAGGTSPLIAEFEGVWFDQAESAYIGCEGRIGLPASDNVAIIYIFVLRNHSAEGSLSIAQGSWLGKFTVILDSTADTLATVGSQLQANIGDTLALVSQVLLRFAL